METKHMTVTIQREKTPEEKRKERERARKARQEERRLRLLVRIAAIVCGVVLGILLSKVLVEVSTASAAPPDEPYAVEGAAILELEPMESLPPCHTEAPTSAASVREDIPLTPEEQIALEAACEEFGVPFELMLGLIEKETTFHNTIGDAGESFGYCQIQPRWWSGLMESIGAEDLMDPEDNFRTAAAILRNFIDQTGNVEDALSKYNTGETGHRAYANKVLAYAEKWRA